ncbi:hypothetical protein, partial [Burkholderia gladioli]
MSDKLSEQQSIQVGMFDLLIDEYKQAHLEDDIKARVGARYNLKQAYRDALLDASPAPAITMPPLNDAMRAVL